jgi:TolB-like protein
MNRNIFVLAGMTLVFSLGGCKTSVALVKEINGGATENKSVIVRRIDAKGDESVRIYIDGKRAGRLTNGAIRSYDLPQGKHSIYANYDGDDDKNSEIIYFTTDNTVHHFIVEVLFNERNRYSGIKITQEDVTENNNKMPGNNSAIDDAIAKSFAIISENIPERTIVAIVNISSEDTKAAEYAIEELTLLFVNFGKHDVVDRRSLDIIRGEQNFQMTGEVDDNSILSLGHILGAGVVIAGSIDEEGNRLRLKALDVKTARIVAMSSERI